MKEVHTKGIPHRKLRPIIQDFKDKIRNNDVVKDMFKEHGVSMDELDLVPMCFAHIPVTARTDHGVIYLNVDMLKDGNIEDKDDHFIVHEMTHYLQQTNGTKPTPGSTDDTYLDNPAEQESFQNQTKYISETDGPEEAKEYVDDLLEHFEVPKKDRKKREKQLLDLARSVGVVMQRHG
jgi:hypothetical protein